MIIDFHTHIFSPQVRQNRSKYATDPCFGLLYSRPEARLTTAEELITSMDEAGVAISVATNIGWATNELCAETNDYLLESISRYPGRLIGFGTVQPNSSRGALAEIERCARSGMKGIGEMRPDIQSLDLSDEKTMRPFAEALIGQGLVLLTHTSEPVGHEYPGKGGVTPDKLYPFIVRYPDLRIVCAHWGGGLPFYALMPEVKRALRNVYFDTAASPFLYSPQVYQQVIQLVGADRILFGSDYPLLKPSRLIKEIDSLGLSEDSRESVLYRNAVKLLSIAPDGT